MLRDRGRDIIADRDFLLRISASDVLHTEGLYIFEIIQESSSSPIIYAVLFQLRKRRLLSNFI